MDFLLFVKTKFIGGVGDGRSVNTKAFERAILEISKLKSGGGGGGGGGGGQLNVVDGYWVTAPFNLTSHMTLFLAQNAVILAIQDEKYWPLMPPLPSYGFGREHSGPRYGSLIHGQNLTDVTITGHNGTIDGQGKSWWDKFRQKRLNHTRGPLVQIMWSSDIRFSNITLQNSPFWTLHPYDCKNVFVTNVTILAPVVGAPNTDGIDPDSCENMVIEDCYISVGDDGVAIKSGWDQYGINYGKPSTNILIKNVVIRSMVSAGVSIGSEMSGGVSNVRVENLHVWNSRRGVRIKTSPGRGGYVRNITYRNIMFENLRVGIVIKTDYNEHPDERYNHEAVPVIEDISFTGIYGHGVRVPVRINESLEIPVKNVVFRDMSVGVNYKKKHIFQCATFSPENDDEWAKSWRKIKWKIEDTESEVSRWSNSDERISVSVLDMVAVWIKIKGLPIHQWSHENFTSIGNKLGCLVEIDQQTSLKNPEACRIAVQSEVRKILVALEEWQQ